MFVLASNTLLRPVVNRINRQPVNEQASEAMYTVYVICSSQSQADVREKAIELLEAADYPVREVDQHPFGQTEIEIDARLYATAVEAQALDKVTAALEAHPGVSQAFWNSSGEE